MDADKAKNYTEYILKDGLKAKGTNNCMKKHAYLPNAHLFT